MLNQLFFHSNTLTRQLSAPFVDERCQYLSQCAAQGMAKRTLRMKARLLLSITEYLRLAERPDDRINLEEIEKVATRWSSHNWPSSKSLYAKLSREYFVTQATRWLRFLNRLQTVPKQLTPYDRMLAEFRRFMKEAFLQLRLNRHLIKQVYDHGSLIAQTNYSYDATTISTTSGSSNVTVLGMTTHDDGNYGAGNTLRGNVTGISQLVSPGHSIITR